MANSNASIEELTASLQELTHAYGNGAPQLTGPVDVDDLQMPAELESFVENTRAYADKTHKVSEGTY
jgi:hypothetical protein